MTGRSHVVIACVLALQAPRWAVADVPPPPSTSIGLGAGLESANFKHLTLAVEASVRPTALPVWAHAKISSSGGYFGHGGLGGRFGHIRVGGEARAGIRVLSPFAGVDVGYYDEGLECGQECAHIGTFVFDGWSAAGRAGVDFGRGRLSFRISGELGVIERDPGNAESERLLSSAGAPVTWRIELGLVLNLLAGPD